MPNARLPESELKLPHVTLTRSGETARSQFSVIEVHEQFGVTNVRIGHSAHIVLSDAAMTAVRKSKCAPQRRNGLPEASTIPFPFRFGK